jgi:pimeloyl-ACP methyl ester carboxylesterase
VSGPPAPAAGERCASIEIFAGERLEVRRLAREGSGPTLILLHEGLGSVSAWRSFPDLLADACDAPILVYSRKGYGRSQPVIRPRPLDYMQREAHGALEAVVAATKGPVVLVGHSDGASIALVHAAEGASREKVVGVVAMAPHLFCEDVSVAAIREAKSAYESGSLRERLAKHHDDVDGAFYGWNEAWLDPGFRAWSIAGCVEAIDASLLVIQGRDDPYGTLAHVEASMRGTRGRVDTCIFHTCGHAPHRSREAEVVKAIASFVAGLRVTTNSAT